MTLELAEIVEIRIRHQPVGSEGSRVCGFCQNVHPCDVAKVLQAFDEEIAAHVFSGRAPGQGRRRRHGAKVRRSARRGR